MAAGPGAVVDRPLKWVLKDFAERDFALVGIDVTDKSNADVIVTDVSVDPASVVVGAQFDVRDTLGMWLDASITGARPDGTVRIHYAKWDEKWDEWYRTPLHLPRTRCVAFF